MLNNFWNNIKDWFSDINERNALIRDFNSSAKMAYVTGVAPTLLKSSISRGDNNFKHQFSHWLNTGFRIEAFNGKILSKEELILIGRIILDDEFLIRKLIVLGFDTLEIKGDKGHFGCKWQLKDFLLLN